MDINDGYTNVDQPDSLSTSESIKRAPSEIQFVPVNFHRHFSFFTTHKIIDSSILDKVLDVPTLSSLIFFY